MRVEYAGVNATDVNISAGRYLTDGQVPFGVGLEALGRVHAVGSAVQAPFAVPGQAVLLSLGQGCYSQFVYATAEQLVPLPDTSPQHMVTQGISGLTAAIGLDVCGRITAGDRILVTAAAGGTGHMAVQLAKAKGCHVIATTSNERKAQLLLKLGADRVIDR